MAALDSTGTVIGAGAHPASVQDATGAVGIQYFVTPYLWLAGTYTTTTTPLGDVGADRDMLHPTLLYRVLVAPIQFADLGVGFRSWGFHQT